MKLKKTCYGLFFTIVMTILLALSNVNIYAAQNGYRTMNYTNNANQTCLVHIYQTDPSSQGVDVAVYTNNSKNFLSNMNLSSVSPSQIKAKTNCGFMESYGASGYSFFGVYYTNNILYKNGIQLSGVTDSALDILDSDMQFYPSFCIRNDWTTAIRWPTKSEMAGTVNACRTIIGSGHPLVYNGQNIFSQNTYDNKNYLIYDTNNSYSTSDRFNTNIGWGHFQNMPRTFFGSRSDKLFLLVVVEGNGIDLIKGAQLMFYLGCNNAVALDSNSASQMRVAGSGKVTTNGSDSTYYGTAIMAYDIF